MTTISHTDFLATLHERFGEDPKNWAFVCPNCGDVATGADFQQALTDHPRERRGEPTLASDLMGQECIGRTLGALTMPDADWAAEVANGNGRGCSWAAYGLLRGPLIVEVDGREIASFNIAEPAVTR